MVDIRAYWQLLRPPNLITAAADVLAGVAIAQGWNQPLIQNMGFESILGTTMWLLASTICLYGGGVVLNDYFDATLDAIERPERPIPSGRVPRNHAGVLGFGLLFLGIACAFMSSSTSGFLAMAIAVLVVLYDAKSKAHGVIGPLNMGLCRGANLLLGISILPSIFNETVFLAVIPVVYIAAVTLISRGEVHGTHMRSYILAFFVYALVWAMLLMLGWLPQFSGFYALPCVLVLMVMTIPPLWTASRSNEPVNIKAAVKAGVLGIIPLNAALAAGFMGWFFGILLLLLLPISILLAKPFAVT